MRQRCFRIGIVFLFSLLGLALPAAGQGTSGSFTGTVSDASGAILPAAMVTATSVDSGRIWRSPTNEAGVYNLTAIPPGEYKLSVEAGGFKRPVENTLNLAVNQFARVDLKMEIEALAEPIEVQGLAPGLQTESTQVGQRA